MVGSSTAGAAGGAKLSAGESPAGGWFAAVLPTAWPASASLGWGERDEPMVSAGSAGMASTTVAPAAAGPPLARASSFPPADAPFGETPPPAIPSDTVSSGDAVLAGAELAVSDLAGVGLPSDWPSGCLGDAMMSLVRGSWSPIRLSSVAREVTTVGEPPPEPSDLSLRLSKPSSL